MRAGGVDGISNVPAGFTILVSMYHGVFMTTVLLGLAAWRRLLKRQWIYYISG